MYHFNESSKAHPFLAIGIGGEGRRWVEARGETWWRFTLFGAGPAYVRAAVGGAVALVLVGLVRVLVRARPEMDGAGAGQAPIA